MPLQPKVPYRPFSLELITVDDTTPHNTDRAHGVTADLIVKALTIECRDYGSALSDSVSADSSHDTDTRRLEIVVREDCS